MQLVYPQIFLYTVVSREVEDNGSETFGGWGGEVGKVHYGLGENGE